MMATGERRDVPVGAQRLYANFLELWRLPLLDSWPKQAWLLGTIAAICIGRAYIGLFAVRLGTWDAFIMLDGAWRTMHGQRPHADFYTGHLGPFSYLLTAAGLLLSNGRANGFTLAHAVFGGVLGLWALSLCARRVQAISAILICLTVVLLAVAPTNVGGWPTTIELSKANYTDSPDDLTPGMFYNRWGYALLSLLVIEALGLAKASRRVEFWGGLSTGVVVGVLLFLKVSYFLAAIVLLGSLLPSRRQMVERWRGVGVGFAAMFMVFLAYFRFTLIPMWEDVNAVSKIRHIVIGPFVRQTLSESALPFLIFILGAVFLWKSGPFRASTIAVICSGISLSLAGLFLYLTNWQPKMIPVNAAVLIALFLLGPARLWRDTLAVSLGGLGLCCAGVFLLLTNWQFYQLPLNAVAAILIMDRLVSQPGVSYVPLRIGVLMLGIALLVSSESMDVRGFAYGLTQRAFGTTPYVSFDAPRLAGLVSYENGGDVPYVRDYAEQVNDGMSLLKGHLRPNDTLVSLDYSNTFSYALGVKPALGGATWLSYGNNFDEVHPGAERLFGNSSLAIVPRIRDVDSVQASIQIAIRRVYGPFLVQHFQLVGESTHWQLYRRRATNVP